MPKIYFSIGKKKYSVVFAEEESGKFAVVTSDSGITKKITIGRKVTVRDFLGTVREIFA